MHKHRILTRFRIAIILTCITLAMSIQQITNSQTANTIPTSRFMFNENRAFEHLETQLTFGPRTPDSEGIVLLRKYIIGQLTQANCQIEVQEFSKYGDDYQNIICKKGSRNEPFILIGAHYDTREYADRDPDKNNRTQPVPGANDGASGVAVLLELLTVVDEKVPGKIWFVFFDGEDNGDIKGKDWILGSRYLAEHLNNVGELPHAVLILDMIGDNDLNIYYEKNSDINIMHDLWSSADELGYSDQFIDEYRYSIVDDHLPFIQLGVPAVDIIDFDYPYWHTTQDTIDKVSIESLNTVGEVVLTWLLKQVYTKETR